MEAYEGVMWSLLWRLEHLETELAVVRSEWDAVIGEYDRKYTSAEIIKKYSELSKREVDIQDEIIEVKGALRDAARRES